MHFIEEIPAIRKIIVFFLVATLSFLASYAYATMSFNADFTQNGTYETSWTMKTDDVVTVDIYVSSVPAPGLIAMGFKLTYDSSRLEPVTAGTAVDTDNWSTAQYLDFIDAEGDTDEIDVAGFRTEGGLSGDNILLCTVTFQCLIEGTSEVMLLDREGDWFVLDSEDPPTVLDNDIGTGILLATIIDSFNLTVSKSGTGTGTVTSSPSGINCGSDCTESFVSGTTVVLTATSNGDSSFIKWIGCDAVSKNTCTVYITGDRTVTAEFEEFPWEIFIPAFIKHK